MRFKAGLFTVIFLCGCAAVQDAPSTRQDTPRKPVRSLESISAAPALVCDPNAQARKEVRVRHLHIEAFANSSSRVTAATPEELLAAYDKLQLARQDLVSGTSFEDAWRKYSDPSRSGVSPDGDLGFARRGVFVSEFERVAFCLPVGELSPVFRTVFGFHVVQVTGVRN